MGSPRQKHWMGLLLPSPGDLLEKAMAPHSSTLAWKIPWAEEPGRLQSMGSLRVGHDWTTSLSLFTFLHWRRKWQPTAVFLPGESQGWGSLVGCHLWGHTESDRLKQLSSSSSRGSSLLRDGTQVSCLAGVSCWADGFFTTESPRKPNTDYKLYN